MKSLQTMLDTYPDFAFVLNKQAKILFSNEKANIVFGRSTISLLDIMPDKTDILLQRIEDTLAGKGPYDLAQDGIKGNLALLPMDEENAVVLYLKNKKNVDKSNKREIQIQIFDFLNKMAEESQLSSWEKIQKAIAAALDILELDIGIVSQIHGGSYEVKQSLSKLDDVQVPVGTLFDLGQTYCELTWKRKEVIIVPHAREDDQYSKHPSYMNMRLESYIGVPLMVKGRPYGTFSLSSPKVSVNGFSDRALEYLKLLGMWIERVIEAEEVEGKNRELDRMFQGIFYESPSAMVFISLDRKIKMVNAAFQKLFQLSEEQLLDADTRIMYATEEDYQSLFEKTDLQKAHGNTSYDMNYLKGTGETFIGETTGYPVRDDNGEISGWIGIMRDRTEENRKEKELLEQKALAEHHARFAAIGEIAAGVSHEVNNPLAVAKGYAAIIAQKIGPNHNDILNDLDKIDLSIERVSSIIKSLGVLARQEDDFGDHGVAELIEQTVNLVREFYRRQGIKIHFEKSAMGGAFVRCHKGKAHQAIYHLLDWAKGLCLASGSELITISLMKVEKWEEVLISTDTELIDWEKTMQDPIRSGKYTSLKAAKGLLLNSGCMLEDRSNKTDGNRLAALFPLAEGQSKAFS